MIVNEIKQLFQPRKNEVLEVVALTSLVELLFLLNAILFFMQKGSQSTDFSAVAVGVALCIFAIGCLIAGWVHFCYWRSLKKFGQKSLPNERDLEEICYYQHICYRSIALLLLLFLGFCFISIF